MIVARWAPGGRRPKPIGPRRSGLENEETPGGTHGVRALLGLAKNVWNTFQIQIDNFSYIVNIMKSTTTRDDFECWLASMTDMLETFLNSLPSEYRSRFDFSPASLDVLEQWILETYPSTDDMLEASESERVNGLACYIGETFRKNLGGKWTIELSDPQYAYYGVPILMGQSGRYSPYCPLTLATASADRRTGTFLRSGYESKMEMSK